MGSGMLFVKDAQFDNCGIGIDSDVPVHFKDGSITNSGIGINLTDNAARESYIEGARFENLRVAIQSRDIFQRIPELAHVEKMDPIQREEAILAIAATEPSQREEVAKNGPIGQFLKRQNVGDWAALSAIIAQGVSIALGS